MLWWPFFFISLLGADELMVEKYCFNSQAQMEKAHSQFRAIAVPADRVERDESCLIISMRPHRRELIQKYLLSNHPDLSISFSSESLRKDPCNLKIEKISGLQGSDLNAQVGLTGSISASNASGSGSEVYQITTLNDFELSVDQDRITGNCRYITPERYEITLTVQKEMKPVVPPVPPGTIVVNQVPPPDQETSKLTTQLQLQRGNRLEIGSIVRDLKSKSHELSVKPNLEMRDDVRKQEVKTFLSIF